MQLEVLYIIETNVRLKNVNARFCEGSTVSAYKMCYHLRNIVRFSHSTIDTANTIDLQWDVPLCYIYTITWQRPSKAINIIGLCNLVFRLSSGTERLKDLTHVDILNIFMKEACLSYRHYSPFPAPSFAVVFSFVL